MEVPLIRLDQVSKDYATPAGTFPALRGIDLAIAAGESLAILGKSGSGKSTLLNLIGGIDRPSRGEVRVGGVRVHDASERALARWRGKTVGVVFQFFQLLPTLTSAENIMLPMDFCRRWPARERRPRAIALLERLGVADQADNACSGSKCSAVPSISIWPRVGRSMPAIRLSSVDLPLPD